MRLDGADFVAETPIYMATDKGMTVVAAVGQTCEKVPVDDLERLERRGKIRRVPKVKKEWTDV